MQLIQGRRIWDRTRTADDEHPRMELTDLVRFKGAWYCSFREGMIHDNHPSGRGRIIRSRDGEQWETSALFDWDGADVREPKFSVTSEGRLMVNTAIYFCSREPRVGGHYYRLDEPGTPESDAEPNVGRQSVTWLSNDGERWSGVYACPSGVNTWRWDVSWYNGMGYCFGYGGKDKSGTLYRTRDGKSWRPLRTEVYPQGRGNEASLAFGEDGTAYCLLRDGCLRTTEEDAGRLFRPGEGRESEKAGPAEVLGKGLPMFGIGKAPYYQDWEWQPLRVDYGPEFGGVRPAGELFRAPFAGPKLLRLRDGRLLAACRMLGPARDDGRITLFKFDPVEAVLTVFAECDGTTYGSIVEHEGKIWVSYASSDVSSVHLANVEAPA